MIAYRLLFALGCLSAACLSCDDADDRRPPLVNCQHEGTEAATAGCLRPTFEPAYYVAQAEAYFDTLDVDADRDSVPNYHALVARWEWPPWLWLTGYTDVDMVESGDLLRILDPSTVPRRDCRFFPIQPFARCYVEFEYAHGPCPIYEEFSFNDAGEMTFIEAWSNLPGLLPQGDDDPWAEQSGYPRLATRVPGLGNQTGTLDLNSEAMLEASKSDAVLADFAKRATNWKIYWREEVENVDPNFFATGCGWAK
ncbi:MAG: hypothetical protein VX589_10475 [Myxococcota bacterium]|nr:hypothetical protein [Myxococcota bacterium]